MRVLFVCLGNICRSPAAEVILREIADRRKLSSLLDVDSAGTGAYHVGEDLDPRMKKALQRHGYRPRGVARQVQSSDFHDFDFIFAMDKQNLANLKKICPAPALWTKASLVCDYAPTPGLSEVPDPYYGGETGFDSVIQLLEMACEGVFAKVLAPHLHS